jgi:hypothetical protein
MRFFSIFFVLATLLPCLGAVVGCGSGGGGTGTSQEPLEAAIVTVEAQPETVDTGGRLLVEVVISEVHPDGIVLKLRYPSGLTYFSASAFLLVEREVIDITPDFNGASKVTGEEQLDYLVFFLPRSLFGFPGEGVVRLQLVADSAVADGAIEVDADIDDLTVSNRSEFSASTPRFTSEDSSSVTVEG